MTGRPPRAGITVVLVAAASGVGQGFGRFTFPALLPAMRRDVLGSYGAAGFIGTANVGAYLIGAIGVMFLSLRVPPATLLKCGLALSSAAMFTLASATGIVQLAIGMLLAGCGGAAIWVPSPTLARAVVRSERSGLAVGVISAGIGAAMLVGSQLARFSPSWWGPHGWRWVWVVQGCVGLAVLAFTALFVRTPPTPPLASPRISALRHVAGWRPYTAGYFLFGFGYIVTITYTVSALRDEHGFSASHAANVYALLAIGTMMGGLAVGRISDAVGRRPALILAYGCCALCPVVLLAGREPWVAVAGFLFGASFSGAVVVVAAYLADIAPPGEFGAAFGAATVAFGAAQAFGPQVGGVLVDSTEGFTATFLASAIAIGLAAVVSLALPRPRPRTDGHE